jgi:hypothetical protein
MSKRIEIGWSEITIGEMIHLAQVYQAKVTVDGDKHTVILEVEE